MSATGGESLVVPHASTTLLRHAFPADFDELFMLAQVWSALWWMPDFDFQVSAAEPKLSASLGKMKPERSASFWLRNATLTRTKRRPLMTEITRLTI